MEVEMFQGALSLTPVLSVKEAGTAQYVEGREVPGYNLGQERVGETSAAVACFGCR